MDNTQVPSAVKDITYALLERLGQHRDRGVSQVHLSRCSGVDARNMFYHVKTLLQLGLMYVQCLRTGPLATGH